MSKFLIELPVNDEIDDLVEIMSRFVKAEFRILRTLETADEKLARAVAGLTGQILTPEEAFSGQLSTKGQNGAIAMWSVDRAIEEQLRHSDVGKAEFVKTEAGMFRVTNETTAPGPEPATGRICMICGKPAVKRSTICGDPECKKKRQKGWDAAWKAKHGKNDMPAVIVPTSEVEPAASQEETAAEPPLAGAGQGGTGSEISSSDIEWPMWAEFRVMNGALIGTFLTRKDTQTLISNPSQLNLEAGTFLLHRDGRKGRLELGPFPGIRFATEQPAEAVPGAEEMRAEKL